MMNQCLTSINYTRVKSLRPLTQEALSTQYHVLEGTEVPPVQALGTENTALESVEVVSARGAKTPRVCMRMLFLPKRLA